MKIVYLVVGVVHHAFWWIAERLNATCCSCCGRRCEKLTPVKIAWGVEVLVCEECGG